MEPNNVIVDLIILQSKQLGPESTVDARPLVNAPFPTSMPEEGPVRDGRLLRRNARVPLIWIPSIEVRVQVNHRDGTVRRLQRPQNRKNNRVIATQTDNPRMGPSAPRARGGMVQDLAISLLHLLEGVGCVEGCDRDVTAVDDAESFFEGVYAPYGVIASAFLFPRRACANAPGAEAGAWSVGGTGVIGKPENGDVEGL